MKIDIRVTEILSRTVTIDSNSVEEALDSVENMYNTEDIVLDYSDFDGDVIIEKKEDDFLSRKDLLVNRLIDYLIKDEEKHYEESEQPKEHIYLTLLELKQYIK